jgi:hypothetical protein
MPYGNGMAAGEIKGAVWRRSSASQGAGNCVEVADLAERGVAVRNSRFPEGPALLFTREEMAAFVRGAQQGEFDDLTT